MAGDVSKIDRIIGLTAEEKALLRNYRFMSSRLAGTRQIRSNIRHIQLRCRAIPPPRLGERSGGVGAGKWKDYGTSFPKLFFGPNFV